MFIILFIIIFVTLFLTLISVYQKNGNAICKSKKKLDERTAIITGGTSGIGLEIALDFAKRGARVIIACPYKEEGIRAQEFITKTTKNSKVVFKLLDLASIKSIRDFSNDVIINEERLDILVNNAGVGVPGDFLTDDGMHFIMQVNYYGHFLLTLLLLPLLIKSGTEYENSRILNMTSMTRALASFDIDNYDKIGYWLKFKVYANSKLCLYIFSRELAKRIRSSDKARYVVVNSADPGLVATRIYESYNVIIGYVIRILLNIFFKNPWEGAQSAIHIALDERAGNVSGEVYYNCKVVNKKDSGNIDIIATKLWERSIKLARLNSHELRMLGIEN